MAYTRKHAAKALTTNMKEAIRSIHDGKGNEVSAGTGNALLSRGLAFYKDSNESYELTSAGYAAHKKIMESGDGPERLKAMFSFG